MNYKDTALRSQFLQFIKIGELTDFKIEGVGVTDTSMAYSPDESTNKWVTMKAPVTVIRSYEVTSSIDKVVHIDDPLFKTMDKLRRKLATGAEASGELINAYLYEGTGEQPTSCPADKYDISISFSEFGGGEDLSISYTINYNGSPEEGTATIDYETQSATFAKKAGE